MAEPENGVAYRKSVFFKEKPIEQTHTGTSHPTEIIELVQKTFENKTAKRVLVSMQLLAEFNQPHHFAFLKG